MGETQVKGVNVGDGSVGRPDLNIATAGQAVITRILEVANSGIRINASTGIDSGTGDVGMAIDFTKVQAKLAVDSAAFRADTYFQLANANIQAHIGAPHQTILDGTGLVRMAGKTITYDTTNYYYAGNLTSGIATSVAIPKWNGSAFVDSLIQDDGSVVWFNTAAHFWGNANFATVQGAAPFTVTSTTRVLKLNVATAGYADTAGLAIPTTPTGTQLNFNWSGLGGQPSWLWGGESTSALYVYNPANFNVNSALTAGSAAKLDYFRHLNETIDADTKGVSGINYFNSGLGRPYNDGALYQQAHAPAPTTWGSQIMQDYRTGRLAVRGLSSASWTTWLAIPTTGDIAASYSTTGHNHTVINGVTIGEVRGGSSRILRAAGYDFDLRSGDDGHFMRVGYAGGINYDGNTIYHAGNFLAGTHYLAQRTFGTAANNNTGDFAWGVATTSPWSFDTIKQPGLYHYDGMTGTMPPDPAPYNFRTIELGITNRYSQMAFPYSSDGLYFRRNTDGVWSTWRTVLHDANYSTYAVAVTNNTSLNSDTRNTRGVTRLYRNENDSDYSVQTYYNAATNRWALAGFNGDVFHAVCEVGYATGAGTAGTADSFASGRTNYRTVTDGAVAGQLMWKNYGNAHTVFDASNSTSPQGTAINPTNSAQPWEATFPTLMGWNGDSTYGVRVDSCRLADGVKDANTLDGFHASQIQFNQSIRDFPTGTLIKSSIDYSGTEGDPFLLEIQGNTYNESTPADLKVQGYIYANTIISVGGISNGLNISGLVAMNIDGKLCFWFPRHGYWHGYSVFIASSNPAVKYNKWVSTTDSAKPAGTKEVALSASIKQSWHSGNMTPQVTAGGSTISQRDGAGNLYAATFYGKNATLDNGTQSGYIIGAVGATNKWIIGSDSAVTGTSDNHLDLYSYFGNVQIFASAVKMLTVYSTGIDVAGTGKFSNNVTAMGYVLQIRNTSWGTAANPSYIPALTSNHTATTAISFGTSCTENNATYIKFTVNHPDLSTYGMDVLTITPMKITAAYDFYVAGKITTNSGYYAMNGMTGMIGVGSDLMFKAAGWTYLNTNCTAKVDSTGNAFSKSLQVAGNGATNDPYGTISVTQPTASNYSYYGLTRAGSIGMGMGLTTSNEFFIGATTTGISGVLSGTPWMRLTAASATITGSLTLGTGTTGQTATPAYLCTGESYSDGVTAAKCKIKLHDSCYGFGIGGTGDVQYHSSVYHDFYISDVLLMRASSVNVAVTGSISATGSGTFQGGGFNSVRSIKDIHDDWDGSALNSIADFKIRDFHYKTQIGYNRTLGFIIDEIPKSVSDYVLFGKDGDAVNQYSLFGLSFKAHQETKTELELQAEKIIVLENRVMELEGRLN